MSRRLSWHGMDWFSFRISGNALRALFKYCCCTVQQQQQHFALWPRYNFAKQANCHRRRWWGGHTRTIVIPFNLIHATDEQSHFYEQTNRWLSHLNCSLHKCLFDWVLTLNCCVKIANAESIVYLRNVLFANNALGLRKCLFIFYCFISYSPPNNAIKTRDGDRRVRFKFCQATEIMH